VRPFTPPVENNSFLSAAFLHALELKETSRVLPSLGMPITNAEFTQPEELIPRLRATIEVLGFGHSRFALNSIQSPIPSLPAKDYLLLLHRYLGYRDTQANPGRHVSRTTTGQLRTTRQNGEGDKSSAPASLARMIMLPIVRNRLIYRPPCFQGVGKS
jgi:hypothetical protein